MTWEQIYNLLGIKDFIYYISSSQIQDALFPVRLIFVCFAFFFLAMVVYFMINSSWLQYKFLEDVTEFFSWEAYGQRSVSKRLKSIKSRIDTGIETEIKLAIIEADDFVQESLDERGIDEEAFEKAVEKAGRGLLPNMEEILQAHETRNSIVYDPDFKIDADRARKIISVFESAIVNLSA